MKRKLNIFDVLIFGIILTVIIAAAYRSRAEKGASKEEGEVTIADNELSDNNNITDSGTVDTDTITDENDLASEEASESEPNTPDNEEADKNNIGNEAEGETRAEPTQVPTAAPTINPTQTPTEKPTKAPEVKPTAVPTKVPGVKPTAVPTKAPEAKPTIVPSAAPTQSPFPPNTYVYGNTSGNNLNHAWVASQDGIIYYIDKGLRKMKADGSGKTLLSDKMVSSNINIVGDWIYYKTFPTGIWKIKKDGTGETQLSDININHMRVVNEWIYYLDIRTSTGEYGSELWKMKTDGSNKMNLSTIINEHALDTMDTHMFDVAGNWIYLTAYSRGSEALGRKLYRVKTDGSEVQKILDFYPNRYQVVGDWIYYEVEGDYYKTKVGTTDQTLVFSPGFRSYIFNIWEGVLYFSVDYEIGDEDTYGIYRVNLDGTGFVKLNDSITKYFQLAEGWIFFDDGELKMKLDGSEVQAR